MKSINLKEVNYDYLYDSQLAEYISNYTNFKIGETWFYSADSKDDIYNKVNTLFNENKDLLENRLLEISSALAFDNIDFDYISNRLAELKDLKNQDNFDFDVDFLAAEIAALESSF